MSQSSLPLSVSPIIVKLSYKYTTHQRVDSYLAHSINHSFIDTFIDVFPLLSSIF